MRDDRERLLDIQAVVERELPVRKQQTVTLLDD